MPHFTKQIHTYGGMRTFYFNRIFTVNGPQYHISARDNHGPQYFMMSERNGSWFISQDTPEWIMEVENELEKAILEHLANP